MCSSLLCLVQCSPLFGPHLVLHFGGERIGVVWLALQETLGQESSRLERRIILVLDRTQLRQPGHLWGRGDVLERRVVRIVTYIGEAGLRSLEGCWPEVAL